jgi:hypothetical protein
MPELSQAQQTAMLAARRTLFQGFAQRWPEAAPHLYLMCCAAALRDALRHPAMAPALVEHLNRDLQDTAWQITPRPAN